MKKKYLNDILSYSNEISFHLQNIHNFDSYNSDITVKRAVERCLEVIGEAMNNLVDVDPSANISEKRAIISLRNRIIHGYDKVDDRAIWNIIILHLPILKSEVEKLLDE